MGRKIALFIVVILMIQVAQASAQRGGQQPSWGLQEQNHKIELWGWGGYVWTVSQDAWVGNTPGKLDIKSSPFWAIAFDINVRPGTQVELLYNRQDSDFTFKPNGVGNEQSIKSSVEYWHIGAVQGIQRDNVMPFTSISLGATRYAMDYEGAGDDWNFSVIFGLGGKLYISERIALRVQGRMPFTFTSGGIYVGCGGGSCGPSAGGTGIAQFDLSAGLGILF